MAGLLSSKHFSDSASDRRAGCSSGRLDGRLASCLDGSAAGRSVGRFAGRSSSRRAGRSSGAPQKYRPFTLKAALELAAPHTWVAAIGPCLIAGALAVCCTLAFGLDSGAYDLVTAAPEGQQAGLATAPGSGLAAQEGQLSPQLSPLERLSLFATPLDLRAVLVWVLMLLCAVLMQAATNTLNDYKDFMSGLDTAENSLDETDASLVYNEVNPRSALLFALALLAIAAVAGAVVVLLSHILLLTLGLIAAAVVVLYSAGPKPLNTLPLGELISGVVMGGIISCATFYAMTGSFSAAVLACALVPVVSIGQIMQTNNTCDIARDIPGGRRTLPICLGARRSAMLNAALAWFAFLWLAAVLVWLGIYAGLPAIAAGLLVCLPKISRLLKGPYNPQNRRIMMTTVVSYNRWLAASMVAALLLGGMAYALT